MTMSISPSRRQPNGWRIVINVVWTMLSVVALAMVLLWAYVQRWFQGTFLLQPTAIQGLCPLGTCTHLD